MVRVGCSGWQYRNWRGRFYPADLPLSQLFATYARHFDTVELNTTFYRLPSAEAVKGWWAAAPPGFVFAFKASRFLTHMKKLREPEEPLARLFRTVDPLKSHRGPALYQLPDTLQRDDARLDTFLRALPPRRRHAIALRHSSWFAPPVFEALTRAKVALCWHDWTPDVPLVATAPFLYLRFHGQGSRYGGRYGRERLAARAATLKPRLATHDVYAYFNNDADGHAPADALLLRELLT